jgi:eukaryotic-like serine/threonine-protein kinase
MTDSSADRDPLERLAEEFVARFRAGERPSLTEYAERLPERADEVRDLFPALVEMEQLKPITADLTGGYIPSAEPSDPTQLGDFRIIRRVGSGGMGIVYEAVQESLGRHVALKLLPAEALLDPKKLERFRREAKAAAKLHHTNIVPVFGTGEADGRYFYAMQFISGHPLDAVIDEVKRLKEKSSTINVAPSERAASVVASALMTGTFAGAADSPSSHTLAHTSTPLAEPSGSVSDTSAVSSPSLSGGGNSYWATVARIGGQVADALEYAHKQGVQHRDIKPANLILDLHGIVWVTDFGLAKSADADNLTQTGDILGTLRYMAPERFEGAGDERADIYALGLTLYELLTLTPAFAASNRAKLVEQVLAANPPRPRSINPAIPRDLETIILKAIARDPAMRYQTAGALAEDLQRYLEGRTISARRASSAEMAFRWCRRNPAVASLLTAVFALLATAAAGAVGAAVRIDNARREANDARQIAQSERNEADAARDVAQRQVVSLDIMTAAQLGDRGDHDQAFHWVARSWQDDLTRLKPGEQLQAGAEADHRLRVGFAADRLPRLVGFCPHNRAVLDADCDEAGSRVVTLVGDQFARVWASDRAECLLTLPHFGRVTSAVFSPDGSSVATSSVDGCARVWDAETGTLRHTLKASEPVARVSYRPDGKWLAVAAGSAVSIWDLATGQKINTTLRAGGLVEYVAYSPDGSRLVTVAQPDGIRMPVVGRVTIPRLAMIWDADSGRLLGAAPHARFGKMDLNSLPPGWESSFERLRWPQFSQDSQLLTTTDSIGVTIWRDGRIQNAVRFATRTSGHDQITASFTPDGKSLVFATRGTNTHFYDLASRKIQPPSIKLDRRCAGLCLSPDGQLLAVTITGGPTTFFQLSSRLALPGVPMRAQEQLTALRFTGDGTRLLTASADGAVRVWQRSDLLRVDQYRRDCGRADQERTPTQVFSPDGRWVATFDPKTLGLAVGPSGGKAILLPHPVFYADKNPADTGGLNRITRFAALFSPTGTHLVTAGPGPSGGGTVRLWVMGKDGVKEVASASTERVVEFSFSADGRRVAAGIRAAGWK